VFKRDMIFTAIFRVRVVVRKAVAVARVTGEWPTRVRVRVSANDRSGAINDWPGSGYSCSCDVLVLVLELLVVGTKLGIGVMANTLLGSFQTIRRGAGRGERPAGCECVTTYSCAVLVAVLELLVVGAIRGSCHVNFPVPDTRPSRRIDQLVPI
jgi:hypothetical protein